MLKKDSLNILSRQVDQAWILDISGEIDLYGSPQVRKNIEEALSSKPRRLIINLIKVAYMDSSGLATLIEAFQHTKSKGIAFALFGVGPHLKSLFEITRLDTIFRIYSDEAEAMKGTS